MDFARFTVLLVSYDLIILRRFFKPWIILLYFELIQSVFLLIFYVMFNIILVSTNVAKV